MRHERKPLSQYLEEAKVEEVASRLRAEGYAVSVAPTEGYAVSVAPHGPPKRFDLIAKKGKKTIAVEVRSLSSLRRSLRDIRRRRDAADKRGYEFRLIVVRPPHPIEVDVEGFKAALYEYITRSCPEKLAELPGSTRLDEVADIEFDSVEIARAGTRLKGSGVLEVITDFDGKQKRHGETFSNACPFKFDVTMTRTLKVTEGVIDIDDSPFHE